MNKFLFKVLLIASAFVISMTAGAENRQIQKSNEDFYKQLDQIVQNVSPQKNNHWTLSKLSLNTSRTHGGLFGLMPFKGTATSTLTWIPKNSSVKTTAISDIKSFDLRSSEEDVSTVARVWYREFLRTKNLPWSLDNEKDFLSLFSKARSVAQEIATIYHPEWYIDQFVVERGLSVKGSIAPLLSAEAAFAVRFSFDLNSAKNSETNRPSEMASLILGLAEDLSGTAKTFHLPAWSIDGFNIGLGVSPLYGVGVVNAKPHAFAHMTFKARKKLKMTSQSLRQQISALTLENMKMIDYNSADSISATTSGEKAYLINREKFRKGLTAALGLAKKMTIQADKGDAADKKWRLGQVVYRFETSVDGNLMFIGLNGKIGAEVRLLKALAPTSLTAEPDLGIKIAGNAELQKTFKLELLDNQTVLKLVPNGGTLSGIESSAFLKFNWGIESPIAELKISAVPQVRLKFSPSK